MLILFASFLGLMALGLPVALLHGSVFVLIYPAFTDVSPLVVMQQTISGVNNYVLLAAPFFIIGRCSDAAGRHLQTAGAVLPVSGGPLHRRPGHSGGCGLCFFRGHVRLRDRDHCRYRGIMIPEMYNRGYDRDFACALTATSGIFGPLIPPSIVMVLYAVNANQSVGTMLIAGAGPGFMMVLCTGLAGHLDMQEKWLERDGTL